MSAAGYTADPKNFIVISSKLRNIPVSISEFRSVLGLLWYFQRSIPNFSQTANPLYQLLKKNHPNHKLWKELIEWQEIQQAALDQLLQYLVTPPILAYPDFVNPPYYTQMHQD